MHFGCLGSVTVQYDMDSEQRMDARLLIVHRFGLIKGNGERRKGWPAMSTAACKHEHA